MRSESKVKRATEDNRASLDRPDPRASQDFRVNLVSKDSKAIVVRRD